MSSNKSHISDIVERIIDLSTSYSTDKEFLKKCNISNHSFLTDLKKGRIKNPTSAYIAKVVRGTGCSGTWLLLGEGAKFSEPSEGKNPSVDFGERHVKHIQELLKLIERIDKYPEELKKEVIPLELPVQFSKAATKLVELQASKNNNGDE